MSAAREPRVIAIPEMPEEPPAGTEWRSVQGTLLLRCIRDGWEELVEPGMSWSNLRMGWDEVLETFGPLTEVVPPRPDLPTDDRPVWAGGEWWWPQRWLGSGRRYWSRRFYSGRYLTDAELVDLGVEFVAPDIPGHPWSTAPDQGGQR